MAAPEEFDFLAEAQALAAQQEKEPEPEPEPEFFPVEAETVKEVAPDTDDVNGDFVSESDQCDAELEEKYKAADEAAEKAAAEARQEEYNRNAKPILFYASNSPTFGEVETTEAGVAIHVKYEFDFSSTLAGKGLDAYTPHIEVDLMMPSRQIKVLEKAATGDTVFMLGLSEAEQEAVARDGTERLRQAAQVANAIALDGLASLIAADKVRVAREGGK